MTDETRADCIAGITALAQWFKDGGPTKSDHNIPGICKALSLSVVEISMDAEDYIRYAIKEDMKERGYDEDYLFEPYDSQSRAEWLFQLAADL